ncbi:MAG: dockerin type I repeat-containing protein [Clostridia bacterium]|nr:dockerin type I repeat-containing protein [Clostridia bacterium]
MQHWVQKLHRSAIALVAILSLVGATLPPVSATSSSVGGVVGGVVGGKRLTSADIESVEVEPIEIIENTYGDWQIYVDEETHETVEYYCYDWSAFISYTITLTNGDVIDASEGYFTYDGVHYPLVYAHAHQDYQNRWLVGNSYTVEHTILGEVYEFPVTVVESPVLSIRCDADEIVIREGTYCDLLPDSASELYQYRWYEAANWIVTYTDGSTETTYDRVVEIDGHNYAFEFTDAQATLQNWTAGNTYIGHAEFLGAECDVDVRITDSFIQNIVFDPIYVYANADGMMNTQYDPELGRDREYFRYNWSQFLSYTATLFDGTVIEGTGSSLQYDNEWYWFEIADTQSLFTPWLAGQSYPVQIAVLGETYTASVRVVANPVTDIRFPNIVIPQGLYGETAEEYDALLNKTFTYFRYDVSKFFDYIVSFADGTTAEATYSGFRYDDRSYGAHIVGGMQNHNNVWEPGNVYHITVNVMGTELVIPVYIQPIPEAEGFGYTRNYDGTVTIRECSKPDERLIIPSTIGEYTVTEIQSLNIAKEYVTEIVIPKSVTRLSWCDFTAFSNLTTIYYEGSESDWRDISHYYGGYGNLTIVYNYAEEPVYLSGDVNGDNAVNDQDLERLLQYLNGWDVEIASAACDVNADEKINNKDLGVLLQYLNGFDVELK